MPERQCIVMATFDDSSITAKVLWWTERGVLPIQPEVAQVDMYVDTEWPEGVDGIKEVLVALIEAM